MQDTIEATVEEASEEFVFEIEELEGDRAAMVITPFDAVLPHTGFSA